MSLIISLLNGERNQHHMIATLEKFKPKQIINYINTIKSCLYLIGRSFSSFLLHVRDDIYFWRMDMKKSKAFFLLLMRETNNEFSNCHSMEQTK